MNKKTSKVIIILFMIFFTISCTLPFYFSPAPTPEEKIVYIEITSTPAAVQATEEATVATEAVAPTVSVNLDGPWTIWQGSSEQQLSIDFLQVGSELIGNAATGGGQSMVFKGIISQDGKSATGTWESTSGTTGNFIMALNDSFSGFSGNLGGGVPFCGTRTGTLKPSPCLK